MKDRSIDEQLVRDCLGVLEGLLTLPLPRGVAEHFTPEGRILALDHD